MKHDPLLFDLGARFPNIHSVPKHIAMLGNFPPRRCGLATYTHDSWLALRVLPRAPQVDVYAMDDGQVDDYDTTPSMLIPQDDIDSYVRAAEAINASGAEMLWIQHEFGIFGGEAGKHLLALTNCLSIPFVVTLHTILEKPNTAQRRVMEQLVARAAGIVAMTEKGREILAGGYDIEPDRLHVVPHGVPDRILEDPSAAKTRVGVDQRPVALTFGLLSPDKGIMDMIAALPAIRKRCPDIHYIVLGATHPHLKALGGETYRESLITRAAELGVSGNVSFVDRFVEIEELLDWIAAADVYVTPYLNPAQSVSGTLSYAVALGKPVVSTPYAHAAELLANENGRLVEFASPSELAEAVSDLLCDDIERQALSRRAYAMGRRMIWERNAEAMMAIMAQGLERSRQPEHGVARLHVRPSVKLAPVERMTDGTGMLQHSVCGIADRDHGYCIDDNARALMLMAIADDLNVDQRLSFAAVYASFVQHAWNAKAGLFRNFMAFDRNWLEEVGSEDSNGRTLWSLGVAARHLPSAAMRNWALKQFDLCLTPLDRLTAPRARAFLMLGAAEVLAVSPDHKEARRVLHRDAELLTALLARSRRPDWTWFEIMLSYDNTRLPEALIRAGLVLDNPEFVEHGLETLEWIAGQTRGHGGDFRPVGTDSFGVSHAPPALFDQQPLEAWAMIDACIAAYEASGSDNWFHYAKSAHGWFLGENVLGRPLIDPVSGECHDGLTPVGVNLNHGAESILSWQMAHRRFKSLEETVLQPLNSVREAVEAA
jgi:glycosyltransferase involved in cell wall biosynthesis